MKTLVKKSVKSGEAESLFVNVIVRAYSTANKSSGATELGVTTSKIWNRSHVTIIQLFNFYSILFQSMLSQSCKLEEHNPVNVIQVDFVLVNIMRIIIKRIRFVLYFL